MTRFNTHGVVSALGILLAAVGAPLGGQAAAQDRTDNGHDFHHNHVAVFVGGTTPFNEDAGGYHFLTSDYFF